MLPQHSREIHSEEKGSPERRDCGASSHIPQLDVGQIRVAEVLVLALSSALALWCELELSSVCLALTLSSPSVLEPVHHFGLGGWLSRQGAC